MEIPMLARRHGCAKVAAEPALMTSRILLLAVVLSFATASVAPAADLCRVRGRGHAKLGNTPSTPLAHTPRKRTPGSQAVAVHSRNRGPYPFIGKRKTPKRTYAM